MRNLGATGLKVSEIAFGGAEIGLSYGANKDCLLSESDAMTLLHAAVDRGINFFDTARMYGCSEERMGKAFKGIRDNIVIATKCPYLRNNDKQILTGHVLQSYIETSLYASLKALQTDYIDVYLAHSVDTEILKCDEVAHAFEDCRRKGLVRFIGVSTYGFSDVKLAIEDGRWNVIQLALNLMDQSCEDLLPIAQQRGIGIMIRSVLMRGILTDKGVDLSHEKLRSVSEHRRKYFELLDNNGLSLSDLAMKFVLSFKDISSALVGIDKIEFLNKAVALANGECLAPELLSRARKLAYPEPEFLNLGVWDRNGWTK
ncbi:MAG: Aldo/keto reductase [candidate division CPR1 bacterium GW2011_GWA2_42_17]|uniref:Aldo/keto reductase n=1 Tax=candidate division CPR1 bacterium GW2011_GWA2_42_17 TaxID=1618341 RepID=A0A0G0Z7I9_9BACT|nr:MAG: Aldo/keto reductase [candidate division CPR1 bacterium GW2011_GWA2_42_17]